MGLKPTMHAGSLSLKITIPRTLLGLAGVDMKTKHSTIIRVTQAPKGARLARAYGLKVDTLTQGHFIILGTSVGTDTISSTHLNGWRWGTSPSKRQL